MQQCADKLILEKQVQELTEKTNNNDYLLRARLQEKDDALVTLSDQVMKLMTEVQELKSRVRSLSRKWYHSSCSVKIK